MSNHDRRNNGRPTNLREGIQGKPLPKGKKFGPPPGPAADVPAERIKVAEQKQL